MKIYSLLLAILLLPFNLLAIEIDSLKTSFLGQYHEWTESSGIEIFDRVWQFPTEFYLDESDPGRISMYGNVDGAQSGSLGMLQDPNGNLNLYLSFHNSKGTYEFTYNGSDPNNLVLSGFTFRDGGFSMNYPNPSTDNSMPTSINLFDFITSGPEAYEWLQFHGFDINPPLITSHPYIKQAEELNIGLEFIGGQWSTKN